MKKLLIFACALLLIVACNKNGKGNDAAEATQKTDSVTDTVKTHEGKQDITTTIKIVVPVGNEALTKSIGHMIMTAIEGNNTIDSTDIKAMAHFFVENKAKELKGEADYEGSDSVGPELSHDINIKILYENDQIITMGVEQYVYLGGAHGSTLFEGVTFDKSTGKVLGKDILAQDKIAEVYNGKDKTLDLPQSGIYIDNDSVVFVYQQYEILPYVFDLPETSLSLKDMKEKGWLEAVFAKTVK